MMSSAKRERKCEVTSGVLTGHRSSPSVSAELAAKLTTVREALDRHRLAAVRLRGLDWFAWATCGGSSAVLLAAETGVAEVLVTASDAWVVTDAIEAARLQAEEVPPDLPIVDFPWAEPLLREAFVTDALGGGSVASDRPANGELPLPDELVASRRQLLSWEVERYRALGAASAEAMSEALAGARPETSELELAAVGADRLLRRGIDPALVLVAGARRVGRYRHPRPTSEAIGERAMVVFCGRAYGLYANLTRFVSFRQPTDEELRLSRAVTEVEAAAFEASRIGATLGTVYQAMVSAYARLGFPGAERHHHQGGPTGYRSREELAGPASQSLIAEKSALAWNPSLPGTKIEDTVLRTADDLESLTVDPAWPTVEVEGRSRPAVRVQV
jgi:Xaa-Pro aminopeptidase